MINGVHSHDGGLKTGLVHVCPVETALPEAALHSTSDVLVMARTDSPPEASDSAFHRPAALALPKACCFKYWLSPAKNTSGAAKLCTHHKTMSVSELTDQRWLTVAVRCTAAEHRR
jgi:hypothetical protein